MHLQPTLHTTQQHQRSSQTYSNLNRTPWAQSTHTLTYVQKTFTSCTYTWMTLSQSITKQDPSVYSLFITQLISTCRYAEIKTSVTAVTSHSRSPIVTARASPITGETNVVGLSEVPHTSFPSPPTNLDTTLHNRPIPHLHHHAS
jgi:hypothetical protein